MDIIKVFLISIFSSSITIGIFTLIVKQLILKEIELSFNRKKMINTHDIERSFKYDDLISDKCFGIYPEMLELSYRLTSLFEKSINEDLAFKWKSDLKPLLALYQENMIKYRAFINNDIFETMHLFKRFAQDIMIYYDVLTREEDQFNQRKYSEYKESILSLYDQLRIQFDSLEPLIKQELIRMRSIHV